MRMQRLIPPTDGADRLVCQLCHLRRIMRPWCSGLELLHVHHPLGQYVHVHRHRNKSRRSL